LGTDEQGQSGRLSNSATPHIDNAEIPRRVCFSDGSFQSPEFHRYTIRNETGTYSTPFAGVGIEVTDAVPFSEDGNVIS
jgi:hypothetical protein